MTRKQVRGSLLAIILLLSSILQACGGGGTSEGGESGSGEKVKIKWATWEIPASLAAFRS